MLKISGDQGVEVHAQVGAITGHSKGLQVGSEEKRGCQKDSKIFGLGIWVSDGVVITEMEGMQEGCRLWAREGNKEFCSAS